MAIEKTPHKRKRVKPLIIIIIVLCLGLGYYAWHQQKRAVSGLKNLQNSGVKVAFSLLSRPIVAVDTEQSRLYLIDGSAPNNPERIHFANIRKLTFYETKTPNKQNSQPTGPDKLFIELDNGKRYEIFDLPGFEDGAQRAYNTFKAHNALLDKAHFHHRDN